MIDRGNLLDAVLDNQDKTDDVLILAVEKVISAGLPFNHDAKSSQEACGISELRSRDLKPLEGVDKNSRAVEALEKVFTKRELALMVIVSKEKIDMIKEALMMINQLTKSI